MVKKTLQTGDFEVILLDITSVVGTPSNGWIAIQEEEQSAGSNLILVNLTTGKYTILNERLEKTG